MTESLRPGPLDSFMAEFIAQINDLLDHMCRLGIWLDEAEVDLCSMSVEELELEYQRINRYMYARPRRGHVIAQPSPPRAPRRIDLAGAFYSPHSGAHVSERAG